MHLHLRDIMGSPDSISRIFFYRVGGTGMGAAATLLKQCGFYVEGADTKFNPPMSTYLQSTSITLHNLDEVSDEHIKTFDLIVVGNVVAKDSEEANRVERLGVPLVSFPAVLGGLVLPKFNVVGITGTHGKTTTTYFLTQIFEHLGESPGYFIGGVIGGRNPANLGSGKYFFIESDEYDSCYFEKISKFRSYGVNDLILTSLEFDHADIFSSVEDIEIQFSHILENLKTSVIYCSDYPSSNKLKLQHEKTGMPWIAYGNSSATGPHIVSSTPSGTCFELVIDGVKSVFSTNVVGEHNIFNLTSSILYAVREGFSVEEVATAVSSLQMVKRRQEFRGIYNGSVIIDDFAHHPRAVRHSIDSLRVLYPNKKINIVMEPNSATARSSIFQAEFEGALSKADRVVLVAIDRPTTVVGVKDFDVDKAVRNLDNNYGVPATAVEDLECLLTELEAISNKNSVVAILSNGTCLDLWQSTFVERLEK